MRLFRVLLAALIAFAPLNGTAAAPRQPRQPDHRVEKVRKLARALRQAAAQIKAEGTDAQFKTVPRSAFGAPGPLGDRAYREFQRDGMAATLAGMSAWAAKTANQMDTDDTAAVVRTVQYFTTDDGRIGACGWGGIIWCDPSYNWQPPYDPCPMINIIVDVLTVVTSICPYGGDDYVCGYLSGALLAAQGSKWLLGC